MLQKSLWEKVHFSLTHVNLAIPNRGQPNLCQVFDLHIELLRQSRTRWNFNQVSNVADSDQSKDTTNLKWLSFS